MPVFKTICSAVTNLPINRYCNISSARPACPVYQLLGERFSTRAPVDKLLLPDSAKRDYLGRLLRRDFNQMLGLQIQQVKAATIFNLDYEALRYRRLRLVILFRLY